MAARPLTYVYNETRTLRSIISVIALGLSVSACGTAGAIGGLAEEAFTPKPQQITGQTELQRALAYWGQEYSKNPGNAKSAVAFARNLKAAGQKKKALSVLQQATIYNSKDVDIASEYGRLALDQGNTKLAQKVLMRVANAGKADWKVISALGTTYAKTGNHAQAQNYFQQAMQLAPGESSIVNNLALSYALDGKAELAEQHLRKAVNMGGNGHKVRQNLALVLGVQGRYNDAKSVILRDTSSEIAQQSVAFLQDMVDKPEQGTPAPAPSNGPALASNNSAAPSDFRGAQTVAVDRDPQSWSAQVATADNKPISLTPTR